MIQEKILRLEEFLLNKRFVLGEEERIMSSQEIKAILFELQYFDEAFETSLENDFARKVITGRIKGIEKYLLYKKFLTLIRNEINLAKISKDDKVLFIGSGPLPMTAILLNRFAGCSVDCCEKRKRSVSLSKKVVLEFGLSKKIKIFHRKGQELDDGSYAVIIIACLAKPKDKILKRVWSIVSLNTRIICRISDGIKQIFYEPNESYILEAYTPINKMHAKSNRTFSSVLLIKSK